LVNMQTTNGGNPANIRIRRVSLASFDFIIDEDQCGNPDRPHPSEWVAYYAIEVPIAQVQTVVNVANTGNTTLGNGKFGNGSVGSNPIPQSNAGQQQGNYNPRVIVVPVPTPSGVVNVTMPAPNQNQGGGNTGNNGNNNVISSGNPQPAPPPPVAGSPPAPTAAGSPPTPPANRSPAPPAPTPIAAASPPPPPSPPGPSEPLPTDDRGSGNPSPSQPAQKPKDTVSYHFGPAPPPPYNDTANEVDDDDATDSTMPSWQLNPDNKVPHPEMSEDEQQKAQANGLR
jgi:hypothetical protein